MNIADDIINLYCHNKLPYELDELLNSALNMYFDDDLQDMFQHKRKSYVIALFLRDIEVYLVHNR